MIAVLSICLMLWTAITLRRHRTTFVPHRLASHLVTAGPFRFSRHPIYFADLILLGSTALMMGSVWPLILLPVLIFILRQGFVVPEEKMLLKNFPEEFTRWSSQVRRWL